MSDTEISLDQVRSEGLRQWNMDMDVEYQHETFNGLPVYFGGDMYDSEDTEEYDPFEMARAAYVDYNFDVPEGMELMTYNRGLPDGGDARGVNEADMVPMCWTVSCVARCEPDESSDTSRTDTTELEETDIEDCDLWTDLWEDKDCPVFIAGSIVDNSLCISSQEMSSYVDVASMGDFDDEDFIDATGFDSDMGSGAEFGWNTWNDACTWESWNASGDFPPDSTIALPAVLVKDVVCYRDDCKFPEWDVCYTGINSVNYRHRYVDGDIYLVRLCLLERPSRRDIGVWSNDNVNDRGLKHRFTIDWHMDVTDSPPLAVCYDCLCLVYLIQTMRYVFYDGDGALEWTDHSETDGCAPVGNLGYLPRCLCSPLVMNEMTQYLTEIRGPGCGMMLSKTMYAGGRRCVCTRDTPPEACSAGTTSRTWIGRRASGGGSVSHTDCAHVIGAVDTSPSGVWIAYIKQALGVSQLVVAAPVTGSLVYFIVFSCRDITWAVSFHRKWTAGGTDWVLQAGYQVLLQLIAELGHF